MLPLLIGAGVGALAGGISAWGNTSAANAQRRQQQQALSQYNATMGNLGSQYENRTNNILNGYDAQSRQYLNAPSKIGQWMNPYADAMQQNLATQNAAQYGSQGKMLSGARMLALQNAQMGQYGQMYNDAFNMMNASNNQGIQNLQYGTGNRLDQQGNIYNVGAGQAAQAAGMQGSMTQAPNWQQNLSGIIGSAGQGASLGMGISNAFAPKAGGGASGFAPPAGQELDLSRPVGYWMDK
jgi:hypothetical protein